MQRPVKHTGDREAAEIIAVIEIGHENLQGSFGIAGRRRNMLDDRFEQRTQVTTSAITIRRDLSDTRASIGVDNRKIKLLFGSFEINEQVVDFVQDVLNPGV